MTDEATIRIRCQTNDFYELMVERHVKASTWLARTSDALRAQSAIYRLTSGPRALDDRWARPTDNAPGSTLEPIERGPQCSLTPQVVPSSWQRGGCIMRLNDILAMLTAFPALSDHSYGDSAPWRAYRVSAALPAD